MKKIALALCLLSLFGIHLNAQTRRGRTAVKKPVVKREIVGQAEAPPLPPKSAGKNVFGVTFERYRSDIDVNADGTATQTWEVRQRLNSALAIDKFANYQRLFNGSLERAEVVEAYILKTDGKRVPVAADKIQIKPTPQAEAAPAFSSLKQIEINFDEAKIGDAICFKVRLHSFKPHFAGHFDELEVFPNIFEWKSIEINLQAPKNYPLYTQAFDLEGGKIADENEKSRWQWRRENVKTFEPETPMYDFFETSPRLAVTSFKNYDELGAAYWAEAREKAQVTPEIAALAEEITKGIKEPQAQAYAIYEWANKNIRYLSVVLERGGWIPHDAQQILTNRYGDCKDYTTILYALLRAKNIESYPVIIRAEMTEWFPEVAVPSFFNHAILYIPSLDLYADATAPNTRLGLIPQPIVGKKAFLAGEKTGVIKTPANRPEDNQLLSETEIDFAADGSLKSFSKNKYLGRAEILFRPMFSDSNIKQNSENFVRLLLLYYGIEGSGKLLKIGNPFKASEPFEVEMQTQIDGYTTFAKQGALRLPVALNLMNMLELEKFVSSEHRTSNLVLGATVFRENFKLKFPAGVSVGGVPVDMNLSNAVGNFRSEYRIENGEVSVIRELLIKKDVVSPAEYPQLRELINKAVASFTGEMKYQSTADAARLVGKTAVKNSPRRNLKQIDSAEIFNDYEAKKLSPREVIRMEAALKQNPDDIETRKKLLRFYTQFNENFSATREGARINHRLWFVRHRPELEETNVYGFAFTYDSADQKEYQMLKTEWLKQAAANKSDARIRINAIEFLRYEEPDAAEKLLLEGIALDAENYEFPLILSEIYSAAAGDEKSDQAVKEKLLKAFQNGETALRLLKMERSEQRDDKRGELLQDLPRMAYKLEKFERAEALATELILDFGGNVQRSDFDDATHIGNTILGLTAARRGNIEKAHEYLLISVRAPLRRTNNHLKSIETKLARELFAKGEKETVVEYLKLCGELWHLNNYKDLYDDEKKALELWQTQIKEGKTPSFDFDKP